MDKPNVFAPFVGPFRVDGRTIVDRNDDAAVLGNLATSESESDRVLRAICFRMNATELATIINMHAELVQFVKHISERAGIAGVERHQAQELLAKCEQIGKGETP